MALRQTTGSTLCPSCGKLVGVNDDACFHCGRSKPGMWGLEPLLRKFGTDVGFLSLVMGACGVLYLASIFAVPRAPGGGVMSLLSPSTTGLRWFGASGAFPVFVEGHWWTVLTAGWLHAGALHIFFNLLWLRNLVPTVSELYGSARLVIIFTAANVCGFLASSFAGAYLGFLPRVLRGATITVGASAAIFGLLGALFYYGRRTGSSSIGKQARALSLLMLVFGLLMPFVDNWAHVGGWLGGYAAAARLDPLQPERTDHILLALLLLAATVAAFAASLWVGRGLLAI